MERIRLRLGTLLPVFGLLLLLAAWGPAAVFALEVPALTGRVNDTAHILSPATIRLLDQTLQELEQNESTQIVVLTIRSLEGESLENYSLQVVESWKIGQKGLDNGALLLISVADRKIRIETGYGLEGVLTDLVSGRIIRERMVPPFRKGNFDQGVIDGVTAMIQAVKGEFVGKAVEKSRRGDQSPALFLVMLVVGLMFIGNIFRRSKPLAAGLGGLFAPLTAALVFSGLFGWLMLLLLIPVGMLGALVASMMTGSGIGYPMGGWSSGGGFGGSSGSDGFSGGGGGFGGGGASGEW